MTIEELRQQVALGEDSKRQFKIDVKNPEALAAEFASFANAAGGTMFIGIDDHCVIRGVSRSELGRINQLISNTASSGVRSSIAVSTENILIGEDRIVIIVRVPAGLDKPYFDKNGSIWMKMGSDKRRICSKEELRRIFQDTDQFHADELPTKGTIEDIDTDILNDYLENNLHVSLPSEPHQQVRLLRNIGLIADNGNLNLAGCLLFAKYPDRIKPSFIIKAVVFPGIVRSASTYLDYEDFNGNLRQQYDGIMAFIARNLHKVPSGASFNSPPRPEIPREVFEELIVNALLHRDYLYESPIRVFIFSNRIEIISPGNLPDFLTVDKMKSGTSVVRNPILVSFATKGLLPYHGIGSGILRVQRLWSNVLFEENPLENSFTVSISRPDADGENQSEIGPGIAREAGSSHYSSRIRDDGYQKYAASGSSRYKDDDEDDYDLNSPIVFDHPKAPERQIESTSENLPTNSNTADDNAATDTRYLGKLDQTIVNLIQQDAEITSEQIAQRTGKSQRGIMQHITKLKKLGVIERVGPNRGGYWAVRKG